MKKAMCGASSSNGRELERPVRIPRAMAIQLRKGLLRRGRILDWL
jgi:hypothetical protein